MTSSRTNRLKSKNSKFLQWRVNAASLARRREAGSNSVFSPVIIKLYYIHSLRKSLQKICARLESGMMFSNTWRKILNDFYSVKVGTYSYGDVLLPGNLPPGTQVGRYCSVGSALIVRRRNHPLERSIMHPFFYNSHLGFLARDSIPSDEENPLYIGHDVWIGDRVTIVGGCQKIGNGAVIAAGAVVTHDVPAYAVVAGVPAKILKMRFGADKIANLEASNWWDKPLAELIESPQFADFFNE